MPEARPLSSDDVRELRKELTAGTTPTVWFTASAVGVQEGRSGKVVALDDSEEGDFIQVRPAGSKDVLSFSAGEVTVVKPPRKRKEEPTEVPRRQAPKRPTTSGSASEAAKVAPERKSGTQGQGKTSARTSEGASASSSVTAAGKSGTSESRRKARQPVTATVTLTATPEGQWTVEVVAGKKRTLRPLPVPASAVAQAAKVLHEDVANAVEPLLEAAREQQRTKVEQLQQELANAQRLLDDLKG